jgi:UDP-N-acetylmuramate--alanine ligase
MAEKENIDNRKAAGSPDLAEIQRIYFIGIGGIGMSALARYFRSRGKQVGGYDRTETALTCELEAEGMAIHYSDDPALAPRDADLIVYTPAVPADHAEWQYYRQHGYRVMKRSEVLGAVTESSFNICVGGTHGKTTVTTLIAHILRDSGYGCNAFLGGISVNYGTNFWSSPRNCAVVEADEYDRSFLTLNPDIAVVTAMDPDHLDIYGTESALQEAFIAFTQRIRPGGFLLSKFGLSRGGDLRSDIHQTYSLQDSGSDWSAGHIRSEEGSYFFDLMFRGSPVEALKLGMGGLHNVENCIAAAVVARRLGLESGKIRKAVESFRGVRRRFEYILPPSGKAEERRPVFIDDYAHHPEELRVLIGGVRDLFPDRKCTLVFQPHLYSRTRDLAEGFARSLDLADEVILLPIYPAREEPMAGVESQLILDKMKLAAKRVMEKGKLLETLAAEKPALLITAGAGDIDGLVEPIRRILEKTN